MAYILFYGASINIARMWSTSLRTIFNKTENQMALFNAFPPGIDLKQKCFKKRLNVPRNESWKYLIREAFENFPYTYIQYLFRVQNESLLILDGNLERDAVVKSNLCYSIC